MNKITDKTRPVSVQSGALFVIIQSVTQGGVTGNDLCLVTMEQVAASMQEAGMLQEVATTSETAAYLGIQDS